MSKLIPILFSTKMVQAIMEGRKTQTRRTKGLEWVNKEPGFYKWLKEYNQLDIPRKAVPYDKKYYYAFTGIHNNSSLVVTDCPYGKPGDVLWVKETFTVLDWWEDSKAVQVMFEDAGCNTQILTDREWNKFEKWKNKSDKKPSLFLFKSLCRLFLEVVSVRVERLHDITGGDCAAEGVKGNILEFKDLWSNINGEDSWNANPFVWVVTFKRIDKPEGFK